MKNLSLIFLLLLVGCSGLSHKESIKLRLIGDKAFSPGTNYEGILFGGLSGIAYDKSSNSLISISDDRSDRGPARFYHLDLTLSESEFDVKISKMTVLMAANRKPFPQGEIDFEGISLTPGRDLVISSEGDNRPTPRIPPSIMMFDLNGNYKGWVSIPERYLPEHRGDQTQGPRNNKAFESLGLTSNGKYLFTGTEDTMVQDGSVATVSKEGIIRIARFEKGSESFDFDEEFAYSLDKVPAVPGQKETRGVNGLVDLIPLSKDQLITLERAWTPENRKQTIKIYRVSLSSATEVSNISSLKDADITFVKKELIADLDQFVPQLKEGKKKLDNIEGIALGPKLPNGNYSLILVSDDNFNKKQRTMLMAFEIL